MKFALTIPGKPQPKQRARRGKGGRWYTPKATRQYEAHVRSMVSAEKRFAQFVGFGSARVSVTIDVYWPDRRRRDLDNAVKSILDGCTKAALWDDDSQVAELTVRAHVDRERPRAELVVEVMDG